MSRIIIFEFLFNKKAYEQTFFGVLRNAKTKPFYSTMCFHLYSILTIFSNVDF